METKALETLAHKMGIDSDGTLKKAEELVRLVEVRSGGSGAAALSGSARAVMCLELAASVTGNTVDRSAAVRVSGVNKKAYMTGLKGLERLLDLQQILTIPDLVVQHGCPQAKLLAVKLVARYSKEQDQEGSNEMLTNTAAMFTAAKKLKIKVTKSKLVEQSGANTSTFDRLVAILDKYATEMIAEEKKLESSPVKRTKTLLEKLDENCEDDATEAKQQKLGHMADEEMEDYDVWEARILEQAHAALSMMCDG